MRGALFILLWFCLSYSPIATAKPFQFSLPCALTIMLVAQVMVGVVTPEFKWADSATRGQTLLRQPFGLDEEPLALQRYEDLANFQLREPGSRGELLMVMGIRRWLKLYQAKNERFAAQVREKGIPVETEEGFLQFIGLKVSPETFRASYSHLPWYFTRRQAVAHLYANVLADQAKEYDPVATKDNSEFVESVYYSSLSLPQ